MAFSLQDIFLGAGTYNNIQNANQTLDVIVDADCELVGAYIAVQKDSNAVDVDATLSIFKNTTDTGVDFTVTSSTAAGTADFHRPSSQIFLAAGDMLQLDSDGNPTTDTDCSVMFVFNRI